MPPDRPDSTLAAGAGTPISRAQRLAGHALALALLGAAWFLDPFAEAAFDAPKRLVVLIAAVVASAALIWEARRLEWQRWPRRARWIVAFAVLGLVGIVVSTFFSPRPEQAWAALRTVLLYGLFVPLGASVLLDGAAGVRLFRIALLATALNALLSLLQAVGVKLPLGVTKLGGRLPTGALLGNEGYVALACALMAAACLAIALNGAERRRRLIALGGFALGMVAIVANQQLTSAIALGVAGLAIATVRWRARWLAGVGAGGILVAASAAVVPAIRDVTWAALPVGGVAGYQRLTTYRLGAWVAAAEMASARPLTGFGPGTFGAEAQTRRLAAEIRIRERLLPPINAGAFVSAHQEYLQLAAEAGIPTLLALLAALAMLFAGLLGAARSPGAPEPLVLLGVLVAGAIAALAWFPLQIPFTAVVLLLACGRAWRVIAGQNRSAA